MFGKLKNQPRGMYLLLFMIAAVIFLGGIYALQQLWQVDSPGEITEMPAFEDRLWRFVSLPVGQGDAHVFISPEGEVAVYDTAKSGPAEILYNFLRSQGIKRINTLVLSHPQGDHIGGAEKLIKNFQVDEIWDSGQDHPGETYKSLLETIDKKNVTYHQVKRGEKRELLPGLPVKIIHPAGSYYNDPNKASVSLVVNMNGVRILLSGDAYKAQEEQWVRENLVGNLDVLRVGHHGSKTSTSQNFLESTQPEVGIISAPLAEQSPYGHPHEGTIHKLKQEDIQIYHTGKDGFIEIISRPGAEEGNYEIITYPLYAIYQPYNFERLEKIYSLSGEGEEKLSWHSDPSSNYEFEGDKMNIFAGEESQLYYQDTTAPRLLIKEELPENWFLNARVNMPRAYGREAGLLIWKNNSNWLHWGPTGDGNRLRLQIFDGNNMYTSASTVDIYKDIGLIKENKKLIPVFKPKKEEEWRRLKPVKLPFSFTGIRAGIYAKSWGDGSDYEVIFDKISLNSIK